MLFCVSGASGKAVQRARARVCWRGMDVRWLVKQCMGRRVHAWIQGTVHCGWGPAEIRRGLRGRARRAAAPQCKGNCQ